MGAGEAFPVISLFLPYFKINLQTFIKNRIIDKRNIAQSPTAVLHALQILKYSQATLFSSIDS